MASGNGVRVRTANLFDNPKNKKKSCADVDGSRKATRSEILKLSKEQAFMAMKLDAVFRSVFPKYAQFEDELDAILYPKQKSGR